MVSYPVLYVTVPDGEAEPIWPSSVIRLRRMGVEWPVAAIFTDTEERDLVLWNLRAYGYEVLAGTTHTLDGTVKNPND